MTTAVLHAFETEALALESALTNLTEADFARPTNCPPWTVKDLVVHLAYGLKERPGEPSATTMRVDADASDHYRRPERKTTGYHERIADQAQERAAELPDGVAALRLLHECWRSAADKYQTVGPEAAVETRSGVMTLNVLVATRVIAHAAHGLDLAISLGIQPWTTREALDVMRPVYVALLGSEPPAALGWDDQTFFAAATGRRSLTESERATLGDRAGAFPLLS